MKVCSIKVNPKRLIKHKNSDLMDIFRKICVAAGVNGLTAQQIHRLHSFGVVVEAQSIYLYTEAVSPYSGG